jgi:catechol 2,3-dioxygenase-like lactoylglutathione lyase family enzyme
MRHHLRIARPVRDLSRSRAMYCAGLGLQVLGGFEDHEGFDGVMLGTPGASFHLELTSCRTHPVTPRPTEEDLLVFYLPDPDEWERACSAMRAAGFEQASSFNPYWDRRGRTFQDPDGYRVVLQREAWSGSPRARSAQRAGRTTRR